MKQKNEEKEKNTVELTKDNRYSLIPNISFGCFVFNDDINRYLYKKHIVTRIDFYDAAFDDYYFEEDDCHIWIDDNDHKAISSIKIENNCYLNGKNIIGTSYSLFKNTYGLADYEDIVYLPTEGRHKHKVYDYLSLGLQIWTWRNRIIEVIASKEGDKV